MIQAIVKKGRVLPEDVPAPLVTHGSALIKVVNSCISAGTELTNVTGSGKSIIKRALEQPEKITKVLNMVRSDGIARTYAKVMEKLETRSPLGYSIAGVVLAVGEGVTDIHSGDRVAAAGASIANHAEYVDVPRNLIMRIPEGIDYEAASTVALGGIAMQGVRRADVSLGEFVVVFGVGILGQLAVQMLSAAGGRVIAVDLDEKRVQLAKEMGAEIAINSDKENAIKAVTHYTDGHCADKVLFYAATNNPQALSDALAMTRKKGRIVMIGVWGNEIRREDMYHKELDFLISTSYGPGRYDENYEQKGIDYPYAYVRWTENRNMEEYLRLISKDKINIKPLIQSIYPIDQVDKAFQSLQGSKRPLMVLLNYGRELPDDFSLLVNHPRKVENKISFTPISAKRIRVGVIGAGAFAVDMHLPNLQKLKNKYEVRAICNRTGLKAQAIAQQFGAEYSTTNYHELLSDPDIGLIMICTRHNLHGQMVLDSLKAGKHTFVEKPLCISQHELDAIKSFYESNQDPNQRINGLLNRPILVVGFNRRFSRYARKIKEHIQNRINPLFIHYRINAGYIPLDHWVHTEEGGGRIIGESCHVIDLFSFLTESHIRTFGSASLHPKSSSISSSDNKSIVLEYEDGSVATLEYIAVGSKELPKERLEVHFDEKTIIVDDFKSIYGFGVQVEKIKTPVPDKGQLEELKVLANCLLGNKKKWPISWESIIETTELTFRLA